MVIRDLSIHSSLENSPKLRLAPVADRIMAFAIDFAIFSPLLHLVLSFLLRKIELLRISAPDSMELMSLIFVGVMIAATFVVILQTIFLSLWGGTPGKLFLKLRVIANVDEAGGGEKLRVTQALMRSVLWVVEVFLLFIPFLEILSHRNRKALHDRGAETVVVTLKKVGDNGPHALESNFIRQVLVVLTLLITSWLFFGIGRAYHLGLSGAFKKTELANDGMLCKSVNEDSGNRVDEALALFLADAVSDECVLQEADFALWTADNSAKAWASLAMAVVSRSEPKLSNEYLAKVCEQGPGGEACRLSALFQDGTLTEKTNTDKSLTSQVLQVMQMERQADFSEMAAALKKIDHVALLPFRLKNQVRALWVGHSLEKARGVFQGGVLSLDETAHDELAAWMCLEELQQNCSAGEVAFSCSELKESTIVNNPEIAWAVIKAKDCSKSTEPVLAHYRNIFDKRKDFRILAETVLNEGHLTPEHQEQQLKDLVDKSSGNIRKWALNEWIEKAKTESSWKKILKILSETEKRDWVWQRQSLRAFARSYYYQNYQTSHQLAKLLGSPILQTWQMQKEELMAAFKAEDHKSAQALAIAYPEAPRVPDNRNIRTPASADSFEAVLGELRSRAKK